MFFSRFLKDKRGGVAPLLALSLVPIMGTVAASIDYSRASATRNSLQAALDSTALMLSKEAQALSADDISARSTSYLKANFHRVEADAVSVTTTMTNPSPGSFVLRLEGTSSVNTMFTNLLGFSSIPITAHSEVVWGIKKLNLALVLDNTGSMAQNGKMTALKQAAHNLLTTMQTAAQKDGDVRVSIVPFATDVNVGTANKDASWIDWTDWNKNNGSYVYASLPTVQGFSTAAWNGSSDSFQNTSWNGSWDASWNDPWYDALEPAQPPLILAATGTKTWVPASHATWNGCVTDRDQNYDVNNTPPLIGSTSTMFPAHQASACPVAMMPLSYDWAALNKKIDDMTPTGNTNTTIGLAWGWQTLSNVAPLNAPAAAPDLDKVIILLTDGTNTQNRWTSSSSSIDSRTATLCTNIKAANIKIYTVRVIDGNANLLRSCATSPSMYYEVSQANQLNVVFASIAQNLANLRIAK